MIHTVVVHPDEPVISTWNAGRWSFCATIWPIGMFLLGVAASVAGLTGLLRLWGEPPRWSYAAIFLVFGMAAMVLEYWQFNFTATSVELTGAGTFTFTSRKRTSRVLPGEVKAVEGWSSLSDSLQILPVRVRTLHGSLWMVREVGGFGALMNALKKSNPEMTWRPERLAWASR